MGPIAIVLNPYARKLRKKPHWIDRARQIAQGTARLWVTYSPQQLERAAHEIVQSEPRLVVFGGGDGTFMAGVTALHRVLGGAPLPPLSFAPAGTVATVARNFGQRSSLLPTLRQIVASRGPIATTARPTLRVDSEGGGTRIGFIFGAGLVSRFFDEYYDAGANGYRTALCIGTRVFIGSALGDAYAARILGPMSARLVVDGKMLESNAYSLVIASVIRDVGLHTLVTYRAGEEPGRPHLVASCLPPARLGPQWPRVIQGKPLLGNGNFDGLVDSFELIFPNPTAYVLDGDVYRTECIRAAAGPILNVAVW